MSTQIIHIHRIQKSTQIYRYDNNNNSNNFFFKIRFPRRIKAEIHITLLVLPSPYVQITPRVAFLFPYCTTFYRKLEKFVHYINSFVVHT